MRGATLQGTGKAIALLCGMLAILIPATASAQLEQILFYHTKITVLKSSDLIVEENITVQANRKQIKRGIYRDFPTDYRDSRGNKFRAGFEVLEVKRDGVKEKHHLKSMDNGVRIYIGRKDYFLKPGQYTYTIRYRTTRQLGFFKEHDELYFNAIPHGFTFPIKQAKVEVFLPAEISTEDLTVEAFTGAQGAKGRDYSVEKFGGMLIFNTTRPLGSYQGMSVVVGFPKGIVEAPTFLRKVGFFLKDNLDALIGLLGLACVFGYFYFAWDRVGKDPVTGTIIPEFSPPEELSAAEMHYLLERGCSDETMAAALISTAIKGCLRIEDKFGKKELIRVDGAVGSLTSDEDALRTRIFLSGDRLELDNENHKRVSGAKSALEKVLKKKHHGVNFHLNRGHFMPGLLLAVLVAVTMYIAALGAGSSPWRLFNWLIYIPLLITIGCFYFWLEAPTKRGRKLLDRIEGFKMYLGTAEADTLRNMGAPQDELNIFEKFLPFAIALGVEQAWSERFADTIARAMAAGSQSPYSYHWYDGYDSYDTNPGSLASSIGSSLSSTIASASTAPGSSSGGGGGGFSGGGGGGGGGGGW